MRRRWRLGALILLVLAVLLAINTVVTDRETKAAKADIGHVLQLPGGDIQVREEGNRTGPTLVLLHGFASSIHWWTPLAQRLDDNFHLIRIDLLGHGGSEKPQSGYSMRHQAELVGTALSALGVKRAVIVGHSMGGVVATALTELRPSLVEGLVLIGTPPDEDAGELPFLARLGFVPVIGEAIRRVVPDEVVRKNLESAFASGFDVPDQFVLDFRRMTYTSYDDSSESSRDYNSDRPVRDRLVEAGKPLLVIFGAEDEIVDPDSASDYRRVRGSRVQLVQGAGHTPMVEKPAVVERLIRAWAPLRGAGSGARPSRQPAER